MQSIDTLIFASWIIPVEPAGVIYEHHAVAVHEGQILAIVPSDQAVRQFSASITYRLPNHVLIPGLINAHTHAAMTLLRGFADDMPLHEWLTNWIWPAEQAWVSESFVADGTRLAVAEMLRGGVTCFNDMYFFPETMANVASKAGIRSVAGLIVIDFPTTYAQNADEYLQKAQAMYEQFKDHPLVHLAFAPHAPYTVSDAPLEKIKTLSEDWQIPIHIHAHETAKEVEDAVALLGERPLSRLNKLGLLSPRLLGVHMTQLRNEEIDLLAEKGVNIAYCPESNMKLGSGFCPVHKLTAAGVNVALGTDGSASNNDLDMLAEMRIAALLAKGLSKDASIIPASEALQMATLNGAKALGIDHITGSLVPGKAADIVAIDMQELETQPMYNPLSHLIYAVGRDKVSDVWVAGKHLLKSRVLISLDLHEIKASTTAWRNKIISTAKNAHQ